jgi:hypothetical protein
LTKLFSKSKLKLIEGFWISLSIGRGRERVVFTCALVGDIGCKECAIASYFCRWDVSQLSKGIYFISIEDRNEKRNLKKLIKE